MRDIAGRLEQRARHRRNPSAGSCIAVAVAAVVLVAAAEALAVAADSAALPAVAGPIRLAIAAVEPVDHLAFR